MQFNIILLLCIIQACTEYLPVSSTAHLVLFTRWLNIEQNNLTIDLAFNLGTFLSTLVYFRKHIICMLYEIKDLLLFKVKSYSQLLITKLFIATIPVILIGYILINYNLYDYIRKSTLILAFCLIFFGILLYIVDLLCKSNVSFSNITVKMSLFIGLLQCIALIPGVSRSGITITTARFQQIEKTAAVKFSFLLALPSTLGAMTLTTIHSIKHNITFQYFDIFISVIFTFILGLIVIHFLLKFISKYNFMLFMLYRIILGIIILYLI